MQNSKEISRPKKIYWALVFNILKFVYFVGWVFSAFWLLLYLVFGDDLLTGFLGDNAKSIIFLIACLCIIISFLIKILIKKRWLRYFIVYLMSGLFFAFFFGMSVISENYFRDFTQEKWLSYPKIRSYMLDDLIENHELIGMNHDEVIELLGEPDAKNDKVFAYYLNNKYKDRVYIEINFDAGIAISAKYNFLL